MYLVTFLASEHFTRIWTHDMYLSTLLVSGHIYVSEHLTLYMDLNTLHYKCIWTLYLCLNTLLVSEHFTCVWPFYLYLILVLISGPFTCIRTLSTLYVSEHIICIWTQYMYGNDAGYQSRGCEFESRLGQLSFRRLTKVISTCVNSSSTNGLSLYGKAASCLGRLLCGVLVWENQDTHE